MKLKTVIAACAVAMLSLTSLASTYTWKSSVSEGDWATADNWESSDGGTSYPQSGDTAIFADPTAHAVALSSALSIKKLDLSASNVDVTLKLAEGVSRDSAKLTMTLLDLGGTSDPVGENGKFTLDGAYLYVSDPIKPTASADADKRFIEMGKGFALTLKNKAYLETAKYTTDEWCRFYNTRGGTVQVLSGSTLWTHTYTFGVVEGGYSTIIDDATFTVNWIGRFVPGGTKVLFKGAQPKFYMGPYSGRHGDTATVDLDFLVPSGGYASAPFTADGHNSNAFPASSLQNSTMRFNVLPESPVILDDVERTVTLFRLNSGSMVADCFAAGTVPRAKDTITVSSVTKTVTVTFRFVDATYTWKGGTSGEWANKDNWKSESEGACPDWPLNGNATVVFPADTVATVTLDSALSIKKLDLSASNVDVTLKLTDGVARDDAKLATTLLDLGGTSDPVGENGKFTLDGAYLYVSDPIRPGVTDSDTADRRFIEMGKGFALTLKDGAYLETAKYTADEWCRFYNTKGGTVQVLSGSTLWTHTYVFGVVESGYSTIIDDATFTVNWIGRYLDGSKVLFRGASPRLSFGPFSGSDVVSGARCDFDFLVPLGGYATQVPFVGAAANDSAQLPNLTTTGEIYFNVLKDSPAKSGKESIDTVLFQMTTGTTKDGAFVCGSVPSKRDTLTWTTANKVVTAHLEPGVRGMLLIIR